MMPLPGVVEQLEDERDLFKNEENIFVVKRKSGRRWIVEKANIPFSVKQKPRFSFPLFAALLRSLIDYAASGK